jgi:hypothetical protein
VSSQIPSLNGLVKEFHNAKKGFGLHVRTIQKLNAMPHLRHALRLSDGSGDLDTAVLIRETLSEFIKQCPQLSDTNRAVLRFVLNYLDEHDTRLGQREAELEVVLKIGRKKRVSEERAAIDLLSYRLLVPSTHV